MEQMEFLMHMARTKMSSVDGQEMLYQLTSVPEIGQKDLAARVGAYHSTVSKMMAKHEKAGAVEIKHEGKETIYSLAPNYAVHLDDDVTVELERVFEKKDKVKGNAYRILFALMADSPHTQKEIVEMLDWNSGSVSVAIRQLLALNMIESVIDNNGQIAYQYSTKWREGESS